MKIQNRHNVWSYFGNALKQQMVFHMKLGFFLIIHLVMLLDLSRMADRIINAPVAGKYIVMNAKH